MLTLNSLIQQGEVCCCLRTKTMFYETFEKGEIHESSLDGPFWCAQTQSLLGPDGGVAEVNRCRPGRDCCEIA